MAGHRPFSELRDRIVADPTRASRLADAERDLAEEQAAYECTLGDVRHARALTQEQLGRALGVSQAQISRIEHQTDLYLSTLRSYVAAMGGEIELVARFGETSFSLALAEIFPPDPAGASAEPDASPQEAAPPSERVR